MTLQIVQVDAFTDRPFAGNPAAVCILPAHRDEAWMQAVAREMNLSETAFLVRRDGGAYDLRWFTPSVEVDLCGHATLASAHVLWQDGHLRPDETPVFETKSGRLSAAQRDGWIHLDFPTTSAAPAEAPPALIEALGVTPLACGRSQFDYLIEVDSEATVRWLRPDFGKIASVPARGVMVTSRASMPGYDFVSRFFGPAAGIDEDPVTGSAHCCLGPWWQARLGKDELVAYQASARGGTVRVRVAGERTHLGGQAVTVLRGTLFD